MSLNGSNPTTAANLAGSKQPFYLYVNNEGNIYVSDREKHCIWLFLSNSTIGQIIAGKNEESGFNYDQFNEPYGIFVNDAGIMYIADRQNHRIMKWLPGASWGVRVAGEGNDGSKAIQLNKPTYVTVDANEYMYISEAGDQGRIIRWLVGSWYGVCIVACTGSFGTATNQLKGPHSLAFDRNGSLYIADRKNDRVQKFQILGYALSYNRPVIRPHSKWSSCGITFANQSLVGFSPRSIFIDSNDTIYVVDHTHGQILVWSETNNNNPRKISTGKLFAWTGVFVTTNGDIYVENDNQTGQIDKWTLNATRGDPISKFSGNCCALFLDVKNNLYCSINLRHIVVKISLNNGSDKTESTAAGENDKSGSSKKSLSHPVGIFVDVHCNLYVADAGNNRIQLFPSEESNGITVAGNGIPNGLQLKYPSGIIVDADNILYIADNQKHRVVRVVGRNHFQCLVGCSEKSGSESTQLHYSYSVRFDSYGNLYVADEGNHRIQKFILGTNSCETRTSTDALSTVKSTTMSISSSEELNLKTTTQQTTTAPTTKKQIGTSTSSNAMVEIENTSVDPSTSTKIDPITTIPNTIIATSPQPTFTHFFPISCPKSTYIGFNCSISATICDLWQPCLNNGTCNSTNNNKDYNCTCPLHFNGTQCEIDNRPCKENTCLNNGVCNQTSNCNCTLGWEGTRCERKINYCVDVTCHNNGICVSLLGNFSCKCLGDSYSGRYCEIVDGKVIIFQYIRKSFAYIAIIAMAFVALFVIMMDVLKYGFGIDPTRGELEQIRQEQRAKRRHRPVIQRFTYINAIPSSDEQTIFQRKETTL
ncbi:hypothetical protein I4U23_011572 [Adineta vaga]|nr:hypothetical protein I4U23_011572 [Adineta vaga]